MSPRKKKNEEVTPVRAHQHADHQRPVIPDAGVTAGDMPKAKKQDYAYSPHLDPVLRSDPSGAADLVAGIVAKVEGGLTLSDDEKRILRSVARAYEQPWVEWAGKGEAEARKSFKIDDVGLHIHERVSVQAIVNAVRRNDDLQSDLFVRPKVERDRQVQYYRHSMGWANRLILGDSLQVMSSLARKEQLAGSVHLVYIDPPYGINFGVNWQNTVDRKRNDGEELSKEPEMVKAYRDTWNLGVHSYLAYLKQRFLVARDLLADEGVIAVQISEKNVHLVRCLLDEVFQCQQLAQIAFKTASSKPTNKLSSVFDYILVYAKNEAAFQASDRFNAIYTEKEKEEDEEDGNETQPLYASALQTRFQFEYNGHIFNPANGWRISEVGMKRLKSANLLHSASPKSIRSIQWPCNFIRIDNMWTKKMSEQNKKYVVQTSEEAIKRIILMYTRPGELVIDPTCGSGTTAYVAEQFGRRWITIDTSRVAFSLARQRLLTAVYPAYLTKDEGNGVLNGTESYNPSKGFLYESFQRVERKDVARNEAIDAVSQAYEPKLQAKLDDVNSQLVADYRSLRDIFTSSLRAGSVNAVFPGLTKADLPAGITYKGEFIVDRKWSHWNLPRPDSLPFPESLKSCLQEYHDLKAKYHEAVKAVIVNNAQQVDLVDRPKIIAKAFRVSGPFSIEGVRHEELTIGEDGRLFDPTVNEDGDGIATTNYIDRMISLLRMDGVTFLGNRSAKFAVIERGNVSGIHAFGVYQGADADELSVAISFGPQYGPVNAITTSQAIEAARGHPGVKELIIAGFSFDAAAQQKAREASESGLQVNIAHIRPDVSPGMEGLLKDQRNSQLFTVFGQPEFKAKSVGAGEYQVELGGVCVYNPLTGLVESSNASKVAAWFLDSDYDGQCFCVSQAFFPDSKAWEKIAKALGSKEDEAAFEAFAGTTSLPFKLGQHRRVAIKVIDPRGNEVMGIKTIA
jgi:adenine-specific DNA-methyltransferase